MRALIGRHAGSGDIQGQLRRAVRRAQCLPPAARRCAIASTEAAGVPPIAHSTSSLLVGCGPILGPRPMSQSAWPRALQARAHSMPETLHRGRGVLLDQPTTTRGKSGPSRRLTIRRASVLAKCRACLSPPAGGKRHALIMSRKGNCWDNAPIKCFFGSMKTELDDNVVLRTRQEARAAIFSFLETFYNRRRLHSAIGYRSPAEKGMDRGDGRVGRNRVHFSGGGSQLASPADGDTAGPVATEVSALLGGGACFKSPL